MSAQSKVGRPASPLSVPRKPYAVRIKLTTIKRIKELASSIGIREVDVVDGIFEGKIAVPLAPGMPKEAGKQMRDQNLRLARIRERTGAPILKPNAKTL